jgi:hypothetical protein
LPNGAGREEPKAPNRVPIAFGNVPSPTVDKLFRRALHVNEALPPLVFGQKPHHSFPNVCDTPLRNRGPLYVPTCIPQVMRFGFEGLNLDTPPAFLLRGEDRFDIANRHLRV